MEIRTLADLRLVGRAMREDWQTDAATKKAAIDAILELLKGDDPKLKLEAAKTLIKADEANIKAHAVQVKQEKNDNDRRIKLLELARLIPVGDLGCIPSSNSGCIPDTRGQSRQPPGITAEADGEEEV